MLSSTLSWLFGLSGGGTFGTDFLSCLVAFAFACKCYPRGCRVFRGPFWDSFWAVFSFIFVYLLMLVSQRTRLETGNLQAPAQTSKTRAEEHMFVDCVKRKGKSDYAFCGSKGTKHVSTKRNK